MNPELAASLLAAILDSAVSAVVLVFEEASAAALSGLVRLQSLLVEGAPPLRRRIATSAMAARCFC